MITSAATIEAVIYLSIALCTSPLFCVCSFVCFFLAFKWVTSPHQSLSFSAARLAFFFELFGMCLSPFLFFFRFLQKRIAFLAIELFFSLSFFFFFNSLLLCVCV